MVKIEDVAGQQLTTAEVAWLKLPESILAQGRSVAAITRSGRSARCNRCGSRFAQHKQLLPNGSVYCPACIAMGRVTDQDRLWYFPAQPAVPTPVQMSWTGNLTPAQKRVADELVAAYERGAERLLWAVTGAGKTEMLFGVLERALRDGVRVAVVSPRIDVILELAPRIAAAFADVPLAVRYGASGPVPVTQLLLATVHQLLRYRQAFGLIVVDEVDAFPFSTDPMLESAVRNACSGTVLFLTATPGVNLMRQVKRGQIGVSYLPRRFHGYPLPVPQVTIVPQPTHFGAKQRAIISRVMRKCQRMLVFVPSITALKPVQQALAAMQIASLTVHAGEPAREERVRALREGRINVLVTTTILERGVTFYNCGVVVLQADALIFATSALVQMAGRAGRSKEHPDDPVEFVCANYTKTVHAAIKQIRSLNRRGAR
ncbi:helicase-related protein [Lacticaseibacillus sharpeae]|uniref:Superfamily II DNA RNA helicase n=1 Tax=Lacticaseibacillus sharpeae JCM 1186 = DSM 20505 TaxID=1291052 RepID=A0A0R1ZUT4_9LACO|nr:helicase-related protein [Lacticaseibacillus sharpeae]KRM55542.1 superfamily II DNA RNA helicase [Lacticaseibacillus sharpeae JCM 1186 = DSM 20505]